jgi:formate dehydrogenase gamma subunit
MIKQNNNRKEEKLYLRMTVNERIQHFLLLSSFITLVITGFALKFPEALWVSWFRQLLGEGAFKFRGDMHRIAAVIMVAVSFYHLGYIIFTQRGRRLVSDLWFRKSDITDFTKTIKYYLGKSKERPQYRRFSYIEKMEYWAVIWGTVVMGITGIVLWFENTFLPVISNSGMDIATAIHYYEAILASLAILVWHFYFVIYNPDVYPMNKAWFTGNLSREDMEHEHPLWLEEIELEEKKKNEQETEENVTEEKEIIKQEDGKTETKSVEDKDIVNDLIEKEVSQDGSETKSETEAKNEKVTENKAEQNKAKQNKAEQNKAEQNKQK